MAVQFMKELALVLVLSPMVEVGLSGLENSRVME
jgi:hypothetical protein